MMIWWRHSVVMMVMNGNDEWGVIQIGVVMKNHEEMGLIGDSERLIVLEKICGINAIGIGLNVLGNYVNNGGNGYEYVMGHDEWKWNLMMKLDNNMFNLNGWWSLCMIVPANENIMNNQHVDYVNNVSEWMKFNMLMWNNVNDVGAMK